MKPIKIYPMLFLTLMIMAFVFGIISMVIIIFSSQDNANNQAKQTCIQYEHSGAIPAGSCACTEKLFTNFSHSYDWMDACAILKGRE